MKRFKDINPELYSVDAYEAMFLAYHDAVRMRLKELTPEHVLKFIVEQEPFCIAADMHFLNWKKLEGDLDVFIAQSRVVSQSDIYNLELSDKLIAMLTMIEMQAKARNQNPIEVAHILATMLDMPDCYAGKLLRDGLSGDEQTIRRFMDMVIEEYNAEEEDLGEEIDSSSEELPFGNNVGQQLGEPDIEMTVTRDNPDGPVIRSSVIRIDPTTMSKDEILEKMISSAKRMMGAIQNLNLPPHLRDAMEQTQQNAANASSQADGQKGQEEQKPRREPWEQFVTNVTESYMMHNPLIGRTEELQRTIRVLCRKDKNNPLHVGEAGVGKTALIYGLAEMIAKNEVPETLQGYTIYMMDMASIVAGASFHGEFEKRMKAILEGAKRRGKSIMYIDEIHNIMTAGGGRETVDAAELMKPYLEDGSLKFIGSTTYQEYKRSIAADKAMDRRFQQIDIKEPSVEDTMTIMEGLLPRYEAHHGVKYDEAAVRCAVEKSHALVQDRFLPDKAIDLLDEAGAYRQLHPLLDKNGNPRQKRYQKVDVKLVMDMLAEVCKIDAKALRSDDNSSLKTLDKRISAEIYGQDEAVRQVVRSVMLAKAGLGEPDKPLASLLFVGPTGVGKTEVCKVLARELGIELVRLDMSEYTEKHTVSKLIGSPAGYVGYDEGGLLTDLIRKTPNCVLLLDEIEKAHSDIYNILLQVMDYARLTDNKGNKVSFKNVILVMTSNAGAQHAGQAAIGFTGGQSKGQAMMNAVKKTFKPEFLNRLSGTVVFNDMDEKMAGLILDKKLRELQHRLDAKKVTLNLSKEARQFLLDKGFTKQYGAREIGRVLQQYLLPRLMDDILFGKLKKGGEAKIEGFE